MSKRRRAANKTGKKPQSQPATRSTADETTQKRVEPHFDGSSEKGKIHTSRGGTCGTGEAAAGCDHTVNCDESTLTAKKVLATKNYNAHHVLPVAAVSGYLIMKEFNKDDVARIHAVYKETKWCINQKANVIALALKSSIVAAAAAGINLPAHNFHHNVALGYTDEVRGEIKRKIWQKIQESAARNKEVHATAKEILAEFGALEEAFKQQLRTRGKRRPLDENKKPVGGEGTAAAFEAKGTKKTKKTRPKYWYMALSMATDDVAFDHPAWDN